MKIKYVITIVLCSTLLAPVAWSQGVAINTTGNPGDSSALLDVSDTTKGILIPRVTTAQRNLIPSPANGLLVYNTDDSCFNYYRGSGWSGCLEAEGAEEKPFTIGYGGVYGGGLRGALQNVYTDQFALLTVENSTACDFYIQLKDKNQQYRNINLDVPNAASVTSGVLIDSTLYLLIEDVLLQYAVYTYNAYNINAGGTPILLSGQSLGMVSFPIMMTSDGTDMYFNYDAGNSLDTYRIAKYVITGTTFVYQGTTVCGGTANSFDRIMVTSNGDMYGIFGLLDRVYKFNQFGIFQYFIPGISLSTNTARAWNWGNTMYLSDSDNSVTTIYNKLIHE